MEKEFAASKGIELSFTRVGGSKNWYRTGNDFWNDQPATNDGMLEGYGAYHESESTTSRKIIE